MKAGDKVTWESQAGGSWTIKNGIVVAEVSAGKDGHITHYYCPSKGVLFATSK